MKENFNADTFDFESEFQKIKNQIKKPNILILGATGVGKSSFVNEVFGENLAAIGDGAPVTRNVRKYESPNLNVNLFDSEGYEVGEKQQAYFENKILGFIDEQKTKYPNEFEKHVHEIWYFVSAANKRFTDADINFLDLLVEKNIPIAIVMTQIDNVSLEELSSLRFEIREVYSKKNIPEFATCVTNDEEIRDAIKPYNQKEQLLEWACENLDDSLKDGFVSSLNNNLELTKKHIRNKIIPIYTASAIGVATIPIPMSDSALLAPIQVTMAMHIINIYGLDKIKGAIGSVLNSVIVSQVGKMLAKSIIGNLAKLFPGIGSGIGAAINGTIAAAITVSIGLAISELCQKYYKDSINGRYIKIEDIFTSKALTDLITKFYKVGVKYEECKVGD